MGSIQASERISAQFTFRGPTVLVKVKINFSMHLN